MQRELEQAIGSRRYEHWFDQKTILSVEDDELTVSVINPFVLTWMQKHFREVLSDVAQNVIGPSARIRFDVVARNESQPALELPALTETSAPSLTTTARELKPSGVTLLAERREPQPERREPQETTTRPAGAGARRFADLSDFVEGPASELALTAVRQVCERPGALFNPLFVHGPVGTGKTHLLEGIYLQIRRRFPALQVVYLTAEAFTNYFTQALRQHTLPSFRQRFRNVDVLLIDDIDFLDSKRVIQEEFLHTFKQLESHGRQIVISSDRHPRLLSKISDELKTRFLSGMVCRLEAPDTETRQRIAERKVQKLSADISPEAIEFVAQRFKNNVRELEGALHSLHTYQRMTNKRVSLNSARSVLSDLERDCIKVVRLTDIEQVVCELFGVGAEELKSAKRSAALSQPRMLAMFLARKHTRAAYSEIGQYFGGRNHSTVMSAEKKIKAWLDERTPVKVASQTWSINDVMETLEQQLQVG
ncbi:MAG TPA: chromosomal replication initiator protein DnaA [Planctomycetaceae bacterium]|nr:chromosomal replication initiator protein DnaA [Planctomycetaceae bacterium]